MEAQTNPIPATATTAVATDRKKDTDFKTKLLLLGITVAALGGTAYGIYTFYEHYKKTDTEKDVLTNPAVQQAETLRAALFRSGADWALHFGTADTDAVLAIASTITDFSAVEAEYKSLYNADLQDDLREKLGADGLQKFLNTFNYNPNTIENKAKAKASGKTSTIGFPAHSILITTASANLRRTAKDTSRWSLHSNIIQLVPQGNFLGETTGKTAFDNDGASNTGTLYVEVRTVSHDTNKPIFFWVAASQVRVLPYDEYKAKRPPFTRINEKDTLNGLEILNKQLITAYPAPIMDAKFKLVAMASPKQELGRELMQLNDGKGNQYVKFLSHQQNEYWVNKKFIKII